MITDVERDTDVPDHRSPAPPVVPTLISARFPGRPRAAGWPATRQGHEQVFDRLTRAPFLLDSAGAQKERRRGLVALLDWLGAQPGASWQDRWLASGADPAGADWRRIPAQWLRATGRTEGLTGPLGAALTVAVCADVLRPSIAWFVRAVPRGGALARGMAQTRDAAGFARLRQVCDLDRHLPAAAGRHTLHRAAVGLGAHGGMIADVTVGDVLELLDAESAAHRKPMAHGVAFYRALHQSGILGPDAPARLEELRSTGQRTPAELIDRFALACQPIRDLLVDYLAERHPRLDYSSLRSLAADLGNVFWKDLERHHPGINSLHLTPEVAAAWKQRLRTRQKTTTTATGEKTAITVDRIGYRQCLTPVRAFYLDLAQWALEGPRPLGTVGRSLPRRRGGDQPAQGRQASQVAHGRAHPPAAARPPGPGARRRRAAQDH